MKLCFQGSAAMSEIKRYAERSLWVGIGTFGLNHGCEFLPYLPETSQIIVGIPREEEKHSTLIHKLRVIKRYHPRNILISLRYDFHAKYALFKTRRSQYIMLGSANCTHSPAIETVVFLEDESLYSIIAKRHAKWFLGGELLEKDNTPKLSRSQLASLSTTPVSR